MQRRTAVLTGLVLALAACGSTQGAVKTASPSSAGAASPSERQALIAIAEVPSGGYSAGPTPVRLMQADGKEVDRVTIKQGVTEVAAAAGSRIFVLEGNGALKAVHKDGSIEDLGRLGDRPPEGFMVSPDGRRWMWGTNDGQTAQVHLAGDGLAPRVVAESHENARAIRPYSWTLVGAFLADGPVGIGGYILFYPALGPVKKVDPASFSVTPVAHTDTCQFSDMARDGTIACFPGGGAQNSSSLSLIAPDGKVTTIALAMPRFTQYGDAYFSQDGRQLTVAGATSVGSSNQPEQYGTDLVTTSNASIKRLSIDGVRLSETIGALSWAADGSLVVWRPDGAAGGPAGVFLVSTSGKVIQLGGGGRPIGLISG